MNNLDNWSTKGSLLVKSKLLVFDGLTSCPVRDIFNMRLSSESKLMYTFGVNSNEEDSLSHHFPSGTCFCLSNKLSHMTLLFIR